MSKQADASEQMKNDAQQLRMYEQFEIAKKLYAAHHLLVTIPSLSREKIVAFLNEALIEFQTAGGDVQVGTDVFGLRGPILRCENGDVLLYEIGRLLAEKYISAGTFR